MFIPSIIFVAVPVYTGTPSTIHIGSLDAFKEPSPRIRTLLRVLTDGESVLGSIRIPGIKPSNISSTRPAGRYFNSFDPTWNALPTISDLFWIVPYAPWTTTSPIWWSLFFKTTFKSVCLVTIIVSDSIPMKEKTKVALSAGTEIVNFPSISVTVPFLVSCTRIEAPTTGLRSVSITTPVTFLTPASWASTLWFTDNNKIIISKWYKNLRIFFRLNKVYQKSLSIHFLNNFTNVWNEFEKYKRFEEN